MRTVAVAVVAILGLQDPGPWRIVCEQDGKAWSVREDGADRRDEPASGSGAGLSPDGKRRAYISTDDGDAEVWVSDSDGKNPKRLTDNKDIDNNPAWTADGKRIVFGSTRTGRWQIWIMEADGTNPVRLTDHADGAWHPTVAPAGDRIAYEELHKGDGKLPPRTLRVMDVSGRDSKVLIEKTQMLGHSWNPKGDRIACSLIQHLRVVEVPSGIVAKEFKFQEIHEKLHAHSAGGIVWRPDGGAIACAIHFVGGRMRGAKVFGDDQVFILPLEGMPVVIEAGGPAGPARWIR